MTETIFVVFIILIIIMLGFVVYSKYQQGVLENIMKQRRNEEVIKTGQRLSSWPELECSVAGITEFACLDVAKIQVISDFINESKHKSKYGFNYYYDLLKNSKITVKQVYPFEEEWVLYDNPGITQRTDRVPVPVNLYDPITETYGFGVLELLIYE